VGEFPYPRRPTSGRPDPAWRHNNSPWWDEVIRAAEEDR
jgi:hypothetical protein